MASSIRSFRLVIPITRMLLRLLTPSIIERSWLITESLTPVPLWIVPLCLQIASISSKIIMWSCDSSPSFSWSRVASLNKSRIFYSDSPTYFEKTSGPLIILGSFAFRALASCLAMRVFPVPGGPYSKIPLTCFIPYLWRVEGGNRREAKALRNILANSASKPPMPMSSNRKSPRKRF